jgi:Transposase
MDREGTDIRKRTANMPSTHRTYDKDFRQEAVNLLLSSGRPLKRVAAELGVIPNCLRTWRNRAFGKMFSGFQLVFSYELLTWQLLSKCFGFSGPKSRA